MKITILNYFHQNGVQFVAGREDKFFAYPNFRHFTAYKGEWDHARNEHAWYDFLTDKVMWLDCPLKDFNKLIAHEQLRAKAKEAYKEYWNMPLKDRNDKAIRF